MNAVDAGVHSFTIPVMGIAFTIDSPVKVARYGITSTVSLVDDLFLEQMRKYYAEQEGEPYEAIKKSAEDGRARRTTAYLNLLNKIVEKQVAALKELPFEEGSDLCRFFELLPEGELRSKYQSMMAMDVGDERSALEAELRAAVKPGAINGNIMTKLDRDTDAYGKPREKGMSDALAAARGYAKSDVDGSLILSAGMNPRLFAYLAELEEFQPDESGYFKKRLVLKVSDFRSAEVQGKVLAKKGLWVSEYRIESGLNCGGHAFATAGYLAGPILQEFKDKREGLSVKLMELYNKAQEKAGRPTVSEPPYCNVTYQGGVGTAEEHRFLHERFGIDSTGWGTPFLLCPEVTTLDDETRAAIAGCKDEDIQLSPSSPLGVPFWNYMNSPSEKVRRARIAEGKPGSPCPKGFIAFDQSFQEVPLCKASRNFQRKTLEVISNSDESPEAKNCAVTEAESKACICHDLSGGATLFYGIDKKATTAICPGPNIVNFNQIVSLDTMCGHIYGREDILARKDRPHMFLRELELYIEEFHKQKAAGAPRLAKYENNMREGIEFYRALANEHFGDKAAGFIARLDELAGSIQSLEEEAA